MKKITKDQIKQIKEGNYSTLMDCLDFLLDSYHEDKYELGYRACLADLSVHSHRLAEHIRCMFRVGSTPFDAPIESLPEVIEEYYRNSERYKG
jgi:hypothetical protein